MGFGALIWGRGRRDLLRRVSPRLSIVSVLSVVVYVQVYVQVYGMVYGVVSWMKCSRSETPKRDRNPEAEQG